MARIIKEEEYNARRSEILDVGLSLVYAKGYEQMTIQDILDRLGISRGAFYHYFASKQALLETLVERMGQQAEQAFLPIIQDPHLSALQKFCRFFEVSARWKGMQKELVISLMRMWYSDGNALIRQKMTGDSLRHTPGLLEPIIRQGIAEKVFTTPFPEQAAVIIAGIALSLSDSIIGLLLEPEPAPEDHQKLALLMDAYADSVERILGAPAGSLKVFSADDFNEWWSKNNQD